MQKMGYVQVHTKCPTTRPRKIENLVFQALALALLKKFDSFWKTLAQALNVALPVDFLTAALQATCVVLAGFFPGFVGSAS